jgi:hypothetical protein
MLILILMPTISFFTDVRCSNVSEAYRPGSTTSVVVILHYDTYYPLINLTEMHLAFEKSLSWLKTEGFPMSRVMIVTWRNTLERDDEFTWLMDTLEKYNVSTEDEQFGLFVALEDAHSASILNYSLETFNSRFERYPFFVAGFSASSNTYSQLAHHGVKLSFFNLWEEGEDYNYRGFSTGDRLFGANWEGSPFQPYKPSKHTANAPGLTKQDELDIWEAHWITRNPSYAFLAVNSRNLGSIHPFDLLHGDRAGDPTCSPPDALQKLKTILDLIDFNAKFNQIMVVSYPVEVSLLSKPDVFEVWQNSIQEFTRRNYEFLNAVELRNSLESLKTEAPHTPVCVWFDNMTSTDIVYKGENTPFALVSSPYGRFIYARKDPLNDSGTPLISVVSYPTARAYNESFQSIRELTGSDAFKMNTFVNGEPIEMRAPNDIQSVVIIPDKAIVLRWTYLKSNLPYVEYNVTTYLTPYGVLVEKEVFFKQNVNATVSMIHHLTVQNNSPTPFTDDEVRIETDGGDAFRFSSTNSETTEIQCEVNDTLTFIAKDGYTIGVTLTSGRPDMVRVFDELGESPFETLQFYYLLSKYHSSDKLKLSYALTPARDIQDARMLAHFITEIVETINSQQIPAYVTPLLITFSLLLILTSVLLLKRFPKRARLVKNWLGRSFSGGGSGRQTSA